MKSGEVWWVEFGPSVGSEMRKTRPAVIVSAEKIQSLVEAIYHFIKGVDKGALQKTELKYVNLQRVTTVADIYHV